MYCTNCGSSIQPNLAFCTACGSPSTINGSEQGINETTIHTFCVECGDKIPDAVKFCPNCGMPRGGITQSPPQTHLPKSANRATIALIAEIVGGYLGILGLGHLYLRRWALALGLAVAWWFILGPAILGTMATGGLLGCIALPIYFAIPITSGIMAQRYALNNP